MAKCRPTGSAPAAASGDTDVLTAVEEQFENLYDVPFITVNRIDGRILAEVQRDENDATTLSRIQEAIEVGRRHGHHLFARAHGDIWYPELAGIDHGVVLLHFTPDRDGGL